MAFNNILDEIVKRKVDEVEHLIEITKSDPLHHLNSILSRTHQPSHRFSQALKKKDLAVIAEVKRKSPSKGTFRHIADPVTLASDYCQGGASAISVLTDYEGFGGKLSDLEHVTQMLSRQFPTVATLRKDFIIHPLQLAEAVSAGASAVLLLASVLGNALKGMLKEASRLGLETLTEVDDVNDLELAVNAGAPIIGVNHRDLKTFEMHMHRSETLRPLIPPHVIAVAESGIHTPEIAKHMRDLNYDAVLVGEALVLSENPSKLIAQMIQQARKP